LSLLTNTYLQEIRVTGYASESTIKAMAAELQERRKDYGINETAELIHALAIDNGWWDCLPCNGTGEIHGPSVANEHFVGVTCPTCKGVGRFRNVGESLALIHAETSEALEAKRAPGLDGTCDKCNGRGTKQEGPHSPATPCVKCKGNGKALGGSRFAEEIADIVIRCLDLVQGEKIANFAQIIMDKHAFNTTRPRKHGKKF
jgi:ssDNA-binding Zn-finger/Zn-ribbon topoisomerase 1